MDIQTNFDIDEEVYIMYANKIRKATITGFIFIQSNNLCSWSNKTEYCLNLLPDIQMHSVKESEMYKTKEELIKSL